MPKCKITVLKKTLNSDLAVEFIKKNPICCEVFQEGQEFISTEFFQKPEGFCDWAWNDLQKIVMTLSRGGNFSKDGFGGWMKDDNVMITCCTDGIRPVIFKVERIEE